MNETIIYQSADGSRVVGRHDGEMFTICAGHRLCTELGAEIERLRAENAVLAKHKPPTLMDPDEALLKDWNPDDP